MSVFGNYLQLQRLDQIRGAKSWSLQPVVALALACFYRGRVLVMTFITKCLDNVQEEGREVMAYQSQLAQLG